MNWKFEGVRMSAREANLLASSQPTSLINSTSLVKAPMGLPVTAHASSYKTGLNFVTARP